MGQTSIEWTDRSVNPIRARHIPTGKVGHYCEKISAGCANCYASGLQWRFGTPEFVAGQNRDDFEIFLDESKLREVTQRRKPTMWFWEDMSDLFGEWVSDEMIEKCFLAMAATPQHTHQILTKRAERCGMYLSKAIHPILKNVWVGISVENQRQANDRHSWLGPAVVTFWSAEPLLEPIDCRQAWRNSALPNWVIVGGESGPEARPCCVTWVRDLVRQCQDANVPVFVKQLGANAEEGYGVNRKLWLKHHKGGDPSEWPEDLRVRQFPKAAEHANS